MSDLKKAGLSGQVAGVRTERYDCDRQTGVVPEKHRFATVESYDRDGRATSRIHENPDGSLSKTILSYNQRGDLAELCYEMNGQPGNKTVYHYDEAGRLTSAISRSPGGTEWESEKHTYDAEGRKTSVQFRMPDPALAELLAGNARRFAEGSKNRTVGIDITQLPGSTTIIHDLQGNPLEELKHDEDHVLIDKTSYTYDTDGRFIEKRVESGGKPPFPLLADDPPAGSPEREILEKMFGKLFEPGKVTSRTTYAYDAEGRLKEEVSCQEPFGYRKNTFAYDTRGNRVLQEKVKNLQRGRPRRANGESGSR